MLKEEIALWFQETVGQGTDIMELALESTGELGVDNGKAEFVACLEVAEKMQADQSSFESIALALGDLVKALGKVWSLPEVSNEVESPEEVLHRVAVQALGRDDEYLLPDE